MVLDTPEGYSNVPVMVRVRGIEPRSNAWEALVLPLNYTRYCARHDILTVLTM